MGSAPVRRGFEARLGSSVKRGAPVGPGMSGVYRVRRPRAAQEQAPAGRTPRGGSVAAIYWYDAADATTSDWPAHSGAGTLLTASGTPTLVPTAVNGQPGYRLDTGEGYATASETAHAFSSGMTALYVVKMGTNPGSRLQMVAGTDTSYNWSDSSFGEIRLEYTDELGSSVRYDYNAPAGSAAYICEWTISAAGVPSLKINGSAQVETNIIGSAGGTTEAVGSLSIGIPAQAPTVCELMVFDAGDSGLSAARSYLAAKYALTA